MLGIARKAEVKIIIDVLQWTSTHGHTNFGRPVKIYIHQVCADTECDLEGLNKGHNRLMIITCTYVNYSKLIFTFETLFKFPHYFRCQYFKGLLIVVFKMRIASSTMSVSQNLFGHCGRISNNLLHGISWRKWWLLSSAYSPSNLRQVVLGYMVPAIRNKPWHYFLFMSVCFL